MVSYERRALLARITFLLPRFYRWPREGNGKDQTTLSHLNIELSLPFYLIYLY